MLPPRPFAWEEKRNKSQRQNTAERSPSHQPVMRGGCDKPSQQVQQHSSGMVAGRAKTVKAVPNVRKNYCRSNLAFGIAALKLVEGRKSKVKNGAVDLPNEVPVMPLPGAVLFPHALL